MDYTSMRSLLEDPDVQELLLVLGLFDRKNDRKSLTELCEHLDKMNQTMEGVISEVAGMKDQFLKNQHKSLQESVSDIMEKIGEEALDMKRHLYSIRQEIKEKSAEVVHEVLNQGFLGLRKMYGFLGIKEKLMGMKEIAEKNLAKAETAIERIEQAGDHSRQAMVDIGNVGRSLMGKETGTVNPEKPHYVEGAILGPVKLCRSFYSALSGQIDKAARSIDAFSFKEVIREEQQEPLYLTQEPNMEIMPIVQETGNTLDPTTDIEVFLNAWERQQKRIGAENRPLLQDKAKTL